MKKYLEILQNNFFLTLNLSVLLAYLFSLYLEKELGFSFFLNIIGIVYLFFITPYNILRIFKKRSALLSSSFTEKYLFCLSVYFFFFVPSFFALNHFFNFSLNPINILLLNLFFFALSLVIAGDKNILPKKIRLEKQIFKDNWPLTAGILLFILFHLINFHFYQFVPEWDGYSDLIKIEETLSQEKITAEYRSFFISSSAILSSFSKIDPYQIFSFWFVILQTTIILVLYEFLRIHQIKNRLLQFFVLLASLSVPVLSMEIDMIRPQNIAIAFLPVFIFFLYQALAKKSFFYWMLAFFVSALGLNYHEFFIFSFGLFWLVFLWRIFQKYLLESKDKKDKIIFVLIVSTLFLVFLLLNEQLKSFSFVWHILKSIIRNISDVEGWRWWFLGNYNTDGPDLNLGWQGIAGAMKYYAYYLSPFTLFIGATIFYFGLRSRSFLRSALFFIIAPLFLVMLAFAEIFPRLNFVFLPERFWVFINILILLSVIPLLQNLEKIAISSKAKKFIFSIGIFSILLGIGGSFYVAKSKMALTTKEDFPAVEWIKNNTPENSVFVSQSSNGPMIRYFAKREFAMPSKEFFLSPEIESFPTEIKLEMLNEEKKQHLEKISSNLDFGSLEEKIKEKNPEKLFEELTDDLKNYRKLEEKISQKEEIAKSPLYILYSENKFSSLYSQRAWWLGANFFGANLEKFNDAFELVYNENGVYIWKVK